MKWLAILWTAGLLAACSIPDAPGRGTAATTPEVSGDSRLADGTICRIGPDGGTVVADRGIGGTGAPVLADRGIGGTGIVGVITGFASICVNGLEVRYDSSAPVDINGVPASTAALRVGQIVAIQARGPQTAPVATAISVRQEVSGRIEAVELGSGLLTIAGQPVAVAAQTRGANAIRLGDWVSVSGLRGANGTLVASRLDAALPETFTVHGQVEQDGLVTRVGGLALTGAAASMLTNGQSVTVSGRYVSGQAQVTTAAGDGLASNPGEYFGPGVTHLVLEAFVRVTNGSVWLNGLKVNAAPGVSGTANTRGIAIVSLDRKSDGKFTAVSMHYTDSGGFGTGTSKVSTGAVRGDTSLVSPQARHGSSLAPATPTDDTDPASAVAPVASLSNPSSAAGSVVTGAGSPAGSTGSGGETATPAAATSVPFAPAASSGAARIESVAPGLRPSTGDLISLVTPAGTATVVSAAASGSSAGATHAVLVSGSSPSSAASLVTSVSEGGGSAADSSPHVVVSTPKAGAIGTGAARSSTISPSRQGGH